MKVTVKLFGPFADAAGSKELTVKMDDPSPTAGTVIDRLGTAQPALRPLLVGSRLAVNCQCVPEGHPISPGDELAIIGLVSGG